MNPANKPDAFEEGALREIRSNNLKEYYELTDNGFRYARAVFQKASCIACHGDANSAPNDVKVRYGTANGFGFKEGDVAGIISVRLPAKSFWDVALNVIGVWELAMIVAAFIIAMLLCTAPSSRPCAGSPRQRKISLGKPADLESFEDQPEQRQRAAPACARHRALTRFHQHGDPAS